MPWIRSGHRTMFLTLEDETELGQVVVFNDVYLKYGRVLKDAIYLLVEGELQNDEEHGLAVVAHQIMDLTKVLGRDEALPRGARRARRPGRRARRPGRRARRRPDLPAPRRLGSAGRGAAHAAGTHRLNAATILAFHDVSGRVASSTLRTSTSGHASTSEAERLPRERAPTGSAQKTATLITTSSPLRKREPATGSCSVTSPGYVPQPAT